jgi:hypothetical protein
MHFVEASVGDALGDVGALAAEFSWHPDKASGKVEGVGSRGPMVDEGIQDIKVTSLGTTTPYLARVVILGEPVSVAEASSNNNRQIEATRVETRDAEPLSHLAVQKGDECDEDVKLVEALVAYDPEALEAAEGVQQCSPDGYDLMAGDRRKGVFTLLLRFPWRRRRKLRIWHGFEVDGQRVPVHEADSEQRTRRDGITSKRASEVLFTAPMPPPCSLHASCESQPTFSAGKGTPSNFTAAIFARSPRRS